MKLKLLFLFYVAQHYNGETCADKKSIISMRIDFYCIISSIYCFNPSYIGWPISTVLFEAWGTIWLDWVSQCLFSGKHSSMKNSINFLTLYCQTTTTHTICCGIAMESSGRRLFLLLFGCCFSAVVKFSKCEGIYHETFNGNTIKVLAFQV